MYDPYILEVIANSGVLGVTSDSRRVKPGYVFVLMRVENSRFVLDAEANGASIIVAPFASKTVISFLKMNGVSRLIFCDNPRNIYHKIASLLYPKCPANVVAVTGTNGKGSVVHMFRTLMNNSGHKTASIGTQGIGYELSGLRKLDEGLTTPDAAELHMYLHDLWKDGYECVALEASSHGIVQQRLDSLDVSVAAVTNFTQDHLDYHGDLSSYFNAKRLLFSKLLKKNGKAVINKDIKEFFAFVESLKGQSVIDYGYGAKTIKLISQTPFLWGQRICYEVEGALHEVDLRFLGYFQAYNFLCALGMLYALGFYGYSLGFSDPIPSIPGRMETISVTDKLVVVIDYAHTPDALMHAISSLRWHGFLVVITVFGCGGDRDKDKRGMMGRIACDNSDEVIVCDDNPRHEDPGVIRSQVLRNMDFDKVLEIGDRKKAIHHAIDIALKKEGNTALLISGKGDESFQIIKDKYLTFNDRHVVKARLDEIFA